MKRYQIEFRHYKLSILLTVFLLLSSTGYAQNQSELAAVVQTCIDLQELQDYFPMDQNGIKKAAVVMQRDISLPADLAVMKFNQPLKLMSRGEIVNNLTDTYFMFNKLNINVPTALAEFVLVHGGMENPVYTEVSLQLKKTGDIWQITQKSIKTL